MPKEIASKIDMTVFGWKKDWMSTVDIVEKYQEAEDDFVEYLKSVPNE